MPHVVVAPDKFKGSLSAPAVAEALIAGLREGDPTLELTSLPVADGGEGTVAAAVAAGATSHSHVVAGPTGQLVPAEFAMLGTTAVVELAQASGLTRLQDDRPAPMEADSCGTGELIRAALDLGATEVILAVGGSACTDGGTGMLTALGARFLDASGRPVPSGGRGLQTIASAELTGLDARLAGTPVTLASDVTNPLLGPDGAAAVYGPQKGAGPAQVAQLDTGLRRLTAALAGTLGDGVLQHAAAAGAGAAGGVGFAALAVLAATRWPGIELVLELIGADAVLARADLVITGEGRLDAQTLSGKAPAGVLEAARRHGVPVVGVTGSCDLSPAEIGEAGLLDVVTLREREPDLARCLAEAEPLLRAIGRQLARHRAQSGRWTR
jgi:glycerate kinase